jgi:hypothetical protein
LRFLYKNRFNNRKWPSQPGCSQLGAPLDVCINFSFCRAG